MGATPNVTKRVAGKAIISRLDSALNNINKSLVRGDFKVWIISPVPILPTFSEQIQLFHNKQTTG
jgi:hypothetical protein